MHIYLLRVLSFWSFWTQKRYTQFAPVLIIYICQISVVLKTNYLVHLFEGRFSSPVYEYFFASQRDLADLSSGLYSESTPWSVRGSTIFCVCTSGTVGKHQWEWVPMISRVLCLVPTSHICTFTTARSTDWESAVMIAVVTHVPANHFKDAVVATNLIFINEFLSPSVPLSQKRQPP